MALLVPHFDLPFRFVSGLGVAVVEQDSYSDVVNCVEAIVRTPYGFRDDTPDFGLSVGEFELQPLPVELVKATIEAQEPRSEILASESTDEYDALIAQLIVEVTESG